MATPLQFMERVLPWPGPSGSGWGNLHWSLTKAGEAQKRWRGQPFKTAEELISRAQQLAMAPADKAEDIFFCTSIQSQTDTITHGSRQFTVASRHASTACAIKAIWLDVDVKDPPKGYATKTEAFDALQKFITDAKLPQPSAIVWSGGGMHVYWFSDKTLTVREWAPFAEGLKAEAQRLGLRADYGVTTDPARILRVPGTFNRKIKSTPRPVKVAALGADYDFAVDLSHLHAIGAPLVTATVTKAAPFDLSAFAGKTMHPLLAAALASATDKLSDGIQREVLPLDPTEIIKGCPHFTDSFVNGGQGQGQGLWMLTVLASTWFENGRDFAHKFSSGYPTYDPAETDAMYDRKLTERSSQSLGWPSCKAIKNEGCKHCATCPFQALGKSPLNLGERMKPQEPDLTQQVVTNPLTNVSLTAVDLRLPDGYLLMNGRITRKLEVPPINPDDPPEYEYVPVFEAEIISEPRTSATKPPSLYFKYKHGDNYGDVNISYEALSTDQGLASAFLSAGICVNPDADKFVRRFMRSWVAKIDAAVRRMTTAPLGWVYEDGARIGFAYGGTLYHCNGDEEASAVQETQFLRNLTPTGKTEPIYQVMELVSTTNNPPLEILLLQAWASPLVEVTGHSSTGIMYGVSDSGSGKSTALKGGLALWCAPDAIKERGGVTATALENKMDMLRNLPCVLDELTDFDELDRVSPVFNRIHEGGQGSRANNKGGLRDAKSWQLILACGSNKSIYDYLDKKNVETDAKALRMFELNVPYSNTTRDKTEVEVLVGSLNHNFGHLGRVYAKHLAMNVHTLAKEYEALARVVDVELAPPGSTGTPQNERFWKASVVLTLMACNLANLITGKPYFHYDAIKDSLYATYRKNRAWVRDHVTTIAGSGENITEIWGKVMNVWINNQLATDAMHRGGRGRSSGDKAIMVYQRPPRDRGCPTCIHWLQNPPMVRIAGTRLKEALADMEQGAMTLDRMEKLFGGTRVRMTFLAGIPIEEAKSKIDVWEIPITLGHPLYDAWADKVQQPAPANAISEAAEQQDAVAEAIMAGAAQAARDAATVAGVTGGAG